MEAIIKISTTAPKTSFLKFDIPNKEGFTPFHLAIIHKKHNVIQYLLWLKEKYKLNIAIRGKQKRGIGNTLHSVAESGDFTTISLLLKAIKEEERVALLNEQDGDRNTVLHLALNGLYIELGRLDSDSNVKAYSSNSIIMQLLRQSDQINVNLANKDGRTVLDLAITCYNRALVHALTCTNLDTERHLGSAYSAAYRTVDLLKTLLNIISHLVIKLNALPNKLNNNGDLLEDNENLLRSLTIKLKEITHQKEIEESEKMELEGILEEIMDRISENFTRLVYESISIMPHVLAYVIVSYLRPE